MSPLSVLFYTNILTERNDNLTLSTWQASNHEKQLYIAYTGTASHWQDGNNSVDRNWNISDVSAKPLGALIFYNSSIGGRRASSHHNCQSTCIVKDLEIIFQKS